jgi:hypothetical protein
MFEIIGKIEFDPINVTRKHDTQSTWKKVAIVKFDINDDTYAYYSCFLKKRFNLNLNKPLRGTHLTIINDIVDDEFYKMGRELFHGKDIKIQYDPSIIRSNKKGHWWLKSYCNDAHNIRSVMGLDPNPYFGLHITIGLATHLQLEHSRYITDQCIKFDL